MTRATKVKKRRRQQTKTEATAVGRLGLHAVGLAVLGAAALALLGVLVWRSTEDVGPSSVADPGPVHVHGLGLNPADGALFVATHSGLYRVAADEQKAERVADRLQDTMGFTVVGPDRFLGSGHPDLREMEERDLPPLLGLIESDDAGESWQSISLLGEADFHVLRSAHERVYGYDSSNDRFLVSADFGRSWTKLEKPGALVDVAVDPRDSEHLLAASVGDPGDGLYESRDGGDSWKRLGETVGLLGWPAPARLFLVTGAGQVLVSSDGGRRLEQRGAIGGEPAALLTRNASELYVALHDGTIKRSTDGGLTWAVRSTP